MLNETRRGSTLRDHAAIADWQGRQSECRRAAVLTHDAEDPEVIQEILDHLKTQDETREPFPWSESQAAPGAEYRPDSTASNGYRAAY